MNPKTGQRPKNDLDALALDTIYKVCGRRPQYCRPGLGYETPEEKTIREARERAKQKTWEETREEHIWLEIKAREQVKRQAEAKEEHKRLENESREQILLESEVYPRSPECKNLKALIELNYLNNNERKKTSNLLSDFLNLNKENRADTDVWLNEYRCFVFSVKDRRISMGLDWNLG